MGTLAFVTKWSFCCSSSEDSFLSGRLCSGGHTIVLCPHRLLSYWLWGSSGLPECVSLCSTFLLLAGPLPLCPRWGRGGLPSRAGSGVSVQSLRVGLQKPLDHLHAASWGCVIGACCSDINTRLHKALAVSPKCSWEHVCTLPNTSVHQCDSHLGGSV